MSSRDKRSNGRRSITWLSLVVVLVAIALVVIYWGDDEKEEDHYVVVLSVDGFRSSYPDEVELPALQEMAKRGVRSAFRPCYPSNTFPNHYSMVTGLHPQNHGIVNNRFWAPDVNDYYALGNKEKVHNSSFYLGETIWNTAEKQGVKSASYFWVGSETEILGGRPSYWHYYDGRVPFKDRADAVLAWLQLPEKERPHLITWYLQEPDGTGHHAGPNSQETLEMCQQVDQVIGYFLAELQKLPIADQVDFIVVSDHGMAELDPEKYINLSHYLPKDSFYYVVEGQLAMLYTENKEYVPKAVEVLNEVPHITAYAREDVPEKFHYNKGERIGDIVITPEVGGLVQFRQEDKVATGGAHGYDNFAPEMEAIFYAMGPSFPQGLRVETVPNITLYPLICRLLGLQPSPNDASEADVNKLLGTN